MTPIEGFFIETEEGLIFAVKGVLQPEGRLISALRYLPVKNGKYEKILPDAGFSFLKESHPEYITQEPALGREIQSIPNKKVVRVFNPVKKLGELRLKNGKGDLYALALALARKIRRGSKIQWGDIGVTGSLLVGSHTKDSDIDLVVFGEDAGKRLYNAMDGMFDDEMKQYTAETIGYLFDVRGKDRDIDDFVAAESRKRLQGTFCGCDFQIRLVKRPVEIEGDYGDVRYRSLGKVRVSATVADDSESMFSPCSYQLDNVQILSENVKSLSRAVSFMGRFCENAKEGDKVNIIGTAEKGTDGKSQVVVGNDKIDRIEVI